MIESGAAPANAWRYNPETYVARISRGTWIPYRWHAYLLAELLPRILEGNARVVVSAPPRHGKSSVVSRWLPTWLLDLFPRKRIILACYAIGPARYWSERVRRAFRSDQETITRIDPDHAQNTDWQTTVGGGMRAVGVKGSITSFGGDLLIGDDLHKDWAEAQSSTKREAVWDWYENTFSNRVEPNGNIILNGTRWHKDDCLGRAIGTGDFTEIRLPALAEEDDPLGRDIGEALCPQRYSREWLEASRARNPLGFAGLYQQRPTEREGNIIKRDWIQYYTEMPDTDKQILSWDLNAGEETTSGSFVVGQAWGRDGSNCYLFDQARERWGYTEAIANFEKQVEKWPLATGRYIEKKAAGTPLINETKKRIRGVIPIEPKGSKTARLEAVAPYFQAGNVWVPHSTMAPWVIEWVEELVTFPTAPNDDQVDATTQALTQLRGSAYIDIVIPSTGSRVRPTMM